MVSKVSFIIPCGRDFIKYGKKTVDSILGCSHKRPYEIIICSKGYNELGGVLFNESFNHYGSDAWLYNFLVRNHTIVCTPEYLVYTDIPEEPSLHRNTDNGKLEKLDGCILYNSNV